jgi:hypothetical protein
MGKNTIILFCQGGAGDVLAATPMIRAARKAYPKEEDNEIIVAATYAILLEHNPNIDILIHLNKADEVKDFYSEYVYKKQLLGRNVIFKKFFIYDSILDTPAIGCTKLTEFITSLYGFRDFYDENVPDYYLTEYEIASANRFLTQDTKPIVLLHIFSAVPSENGVNKMICGVCQGKGVLPQGKCEICGGNGFVIIKEKTNALKDLNPNIVGNVISKYKDQFNFIQIGLDGEPLIPGAIDALGMPFRDACALIGHPQVASFIFIESIFAHIAGAFRKKGVVVFQNSDARFYGYESAIPFQWLGTCKVGPCSRPVGALMDFAPGYRNPKTKQKELWTCADQQCAKIPPEELEKAFLKSLEKEKQINDNSNIITLGKPNVAQTLDEARNL